MITDITKAFKGKTLTEEMLVQAMLDSLGSSLYSYMLMLEYTARKTEHDLIDTLRKMIFAARDNDDITYGEIAAVLEDVKQRLTIQITLLKTIPEKAWETYQFNSYFNDIAGAIFFFNDNKDK